MVSMSEIEGKMSFWELARELGVADNVSSMHDSTLPWINHNRTSCIDRSIKSKKDRLACKLLAWKHYVCKQSNYGVPIGTVEDFQNSLNYPITMWRGGSGTYSPDWSDGRTWTSFTGKRDRASTFSEYAGTNASKSFMLPKNSLFWIVELTVRIDDILLYLPHGYDEEFILPVTLANQAKVISTSEA